MRKLTATLCVTFAVLLGSGGMSWSADFQKGLTAAQSEDSATAQREWKPLAEQGMQTTALTAFATLLDVVHIRFPCVQPFLGNDFTPRIALQTMESKCHSRLCEV